VKRLARFGGGQHMNGRSVFTYVNENHPVGALESLESRP